MIGYVHTNITIIMDDVKKIQSIINDSNYIEVLGLEEKNAQN